MAQPSAKELRYRDPVSAAAEEGIIRLLFLEPALVSEAGLPEPEQFSSEALGRIYRVLRGRITEGSPVSIAALSGDLSQEEMSLLTGILQKPELLSNSKKTMRDYITRIQEQAERSTGDTDLNALADRLRQRKGYHA